LFFACTLLGIKRKSLNFNANNNDHTSTIVASKPTPTTLLKSSQADSRVPEEPLASEQHTVLLCIKVPSGCRIQRRFGIKYLKAVPVFPY